MLILRIIANQFLPLKMALVANGNLQIIFSKLILYQAVRDALKSQVGFKLTWHQANNLAVKLITPSNMESAF